MDRTLSVRTPESIAFSYELAGLGSRFLAVLLDLLIQVIVAMAVFWALVAVAGHAHPLPLPPREEKLAQSLAIAFIAFGLFTIFFGYFIIFEAFWNGQTPGKRLLGVRVVRDGGFPVDFMSSLIRNFVRIVEMGLAFYAVSAICTLLSPENKRLGDYAAGTIVVRDSRAAVPARLNEVLQTALHLSLTSQERALITRFLDRRSSLLPESRSALASQIAALLRPRVHGDLAALPNETLIERIDASL
ncbi:MAG: hypothetical protein DLM50_00580 [Candidatus Meridianibacter frigidus]|nr:MAG: hypothetical protein DLM50_00580 [Candidatus Eremiobacteraeota bacterium]